MNTRIRTKNLIDHRRLYQCNAYLPKLMISALFLIFLLSQSASHACTCIKTSKKLEFYQYNQYHLIFLGEVISVDRDEAEWKQRIKFKVSKIYKGSTNTDILSVESGGDEASCGLNFKVGQQWIVYSSLHNTVYYTGLCTRSKEIRKGISNFGASFQEKKFLKRFGQWSGEIARKNAKGKLLNGLPQGKWVYYKDRRLWMAVEFSNGLLHGITESYHSNGNVKYQAKYEKGVFISSLYYDEKGNPE